MAVQSTFQNPDMMETDSTIWSQSGQMKPMSPRLSLPRAPITGRTKRKSKYKAAKMSKLIVSLPAIRKSLRNIKSLNAETETNRITSTERVRKHRQKLKNDVKLSSCRNKQYMYVAKVVKVEEPEIQLRFLQKTGRPGVYAWSNNDVSWQSIHDVLQTLTQPQLLPGRGIKMEFNIPELERAEGLTLSV